MTFPSKQETEADRNISSVFTAVSHVLFTQWSTAGAQPRDSSLLCVPAALPTVRAWRGHPVA